MVSNRQKFCDMSFEKKIRTKGLHYFIGSDESGRGSIAGPVVTASCCIISSNLDEYERIEGVKDSKLLSSTERDRIYQEILSRHDDHIYFVAQRTNKQIDFTNIVNATMESFKDSIQGIVTSNNLPIDSCYAVVDGKKTPKLDAYFKGNLPCRPYVKADAEIYTVALASIIARVTYDRIMGEKAHALFPQYSFDRNFGYSTREHIESIHKLGPSLLHR